MITVLVSLHIVICISLVIVVLVQQGKGADVGAVFGGSSQTSFGSSSGGNALTKSTWALASVFFATSIILAVISTRHVTGSIFENRAPVPVSKTVPAAPANPGPMSNPAAPKH